MVALEAVCYLAMLTALWYKRGRLTLFAIIQTATLIEWPIHAFLHQPAADTFWFWADIINIGLSLWLTRIAWELMPVVSWLLLAQIAVKMTHYALFDRLVAEEFWQTPSLFYASKMLDMAINITVIWYCFQGEGHEVFEARHKMQVQR